MFQIKTDRLRLIPLDADMLADLQLGRPGLEQRLGLSNSNMQISPEMAEEIDEAMAFWRDFTTNHPEDYRWGTNWEIVLAQENVSIGGIGMGGPPNKGGQVTVGYHIDIRYHRQGYASEALAALRDWALQQPKCTAMVAFTPVANEPSQKVLRKCGFVLVDEVEESGILCYFWRYQAVTS